MPDAPTPSSPFLRRLYQMLEQGGSSVAGGMRRGAERMDDLVPHGRVRGAAVMGGLGGAMLGGMTAGSNYNYQDDDLAEAMGGAVGGGALGAGGAALAGLSARGGAAALRRALRKALNESRSGLSGAPPMPRPMELRAQLEELRQLYDSLPDDDPNKPQVGMAIMQISAELERLGQAGV